MRILIIENDPNDALLIEREIRRDHADLAAGHARDLPETRSALEGDRWDAVVCDYCLTPFDGFEALRLVRQHDSDLPFLFVSSVMGDQAGPRAMRAGAQDYLGKDHLDGLSQAIEREVAQARDRLDRRVSEQARRAGELRFRELFENAADLIFSVDRKGRLTEMNPAAERLSGHTREEALGASPLDIVAPEYQANVQKVGESVLASGGRVLLRLEVIQRDGKRLPLEVNLQAIVRDGKPVGLQGIARDMTERSSSEEQTRHQVERLSGLRAIDMAITASLDVRVTLNVLLDQVTAQLHVDAADILLFSPQLQVLEYALSRGFKTGALQHSRLRPGEGYAGKAALERRMVIVRDLQEERDGLRRSPQIAREGFASYVGVPLVAKGQLKGVLEIFHRSKLGLEPDWMEFLDQLASQAALAIGNATQFDELQRTNLSLTLAYDATVEGWSQAVDLRDPEIGGHTRRVTELTLQVAQALGIEPDKLEHVRRGALLHDVGTMGISDSILLKPGPLTNEEWAAMRKHPVYAYELLAPIDFLRPVLDIPYCHHEKWDGSGYPQGLQGDQIPLPARAFAIVDVWDALTSNRPYRPAWNREEAWDHIRGQSGSHFDPRVVEEFMRLVWHGRTALGRSA
jgi:PAS domain S-box-containing protein